MGETGSTHRRDKKQNVKSEGMKHQNKTGSWKSRMNDCALDSGEL